MITINLLPPELKTRRIQAKKNASLIGACIVIVLLTGVIAIIGKSVQNTVTGSLNSSNANISKSNDQLNESKDLQDLAYIINDRLAATDKINQTRAVWSQILLELANSTPTDVQFQSINANSDKSPNFSLQGRTTSEREIIKFQEKLESSPIFKNVNFKSSTLNKNQTESASPNLSFAIEFDLEFQGTKSVSGSFNISNQPKNTK